jgi:hypothetical protein
MSLASLSRIESMSDERQGGPFGLPWVARLDRSATAVLQTSKNRAGIPARVVLWDPAVLGLDMSADWNATGSIPGMQSTDGTCSLITTAS